MKLKLLSILYLWLYCNQENVMYSKVKVFLWPTLPGEPGSPGGPTGPVGPRSSQSFSWHSKQGSPLSPVVWHIKNETLSKPRYEVISKDKAFVSTLKTFYWQKCVLLSWEGLVTTLKAVRQANHKKVLWNFGMKSEGQKRTFKDSLMEEIGHSSGGWFTFTFKIRGMYLYMPYEDVQTSHALISE